MSVHRETPRSKLLSMAGHATTAVPRITVFAMMTNKQAQKLNTSAVYTVVAEN